ncbi:MAG: AAA family ATPase [Oculatellaceae cyanobacterium bins.114]|nr:AAA family ATPase [Oculatellaceae cyanobacterium bins.114]
MMITQLAPTAASQGITSLLTALRSLDLLLQSAIAEAKVAHGTTPFTDPYRGLYVTQEQATLSLATEPGEPSWQEISSIFWSGLEEVIQNSQELTQLQRTYQLSNFDVAVILIAIAPEIDLRYERIYAYLQDDVTRKRPTVELGLNLLCATTTEKLNHRQNFTPNSPLIHHGIIHLIADANQTQPPILAHYLKLDEQIIHFLMGVPGLDQRLQPFSTLVKPTIALEQLPLSDDLQQTLKHLCGHATSVLEKPLHLYFQDRAGLSNRVASAIAHHLNQSLLIVDLNCAQRSNVNLESALRLLVREAQRQQAIVYLPEIDALLKTESSVLDARFLESLQSFPNMTILAGQTALPPALSAQMLTIALPLPNFAQRQTYWRTQLHHHGIALEQEAVNALSDRFRLTPDQIDRAIASAHTHSIQRSVDPRQPPTPALTDLLAAARYQSGQELQGLANKLVPHYTWSDLVLPEDAIDQLQGICNQFKYRSVVLGQWGFERKLSLGKGTSMLFCGSPGTGKTMAAEVIANDLQLDLYRIDLSQVVSKYIGETEKNLDRIFTAADRANAILFFDEADALFGKRSEVKDAHDRYANLEVGYLLQKMEEFTGVSVLATNLRQNLDEAFLRRIQAIIEFPFPDETSRYQLWRGVFPVEAPLDVAIDFEFLAREIKLAGGNIKNIALTAAFAAASENQAIGMAHLLKSAQREYQKSGRSWDGQFVTKIEEMG